MPALQISSPHQSEHMPHLIPEVGRQPTFSILPRLRPLEPYHDLDTYHQPLQSSCLRTLSCLGRLEAPRHVLPNGLLSDDAPKYLLMSCCCDIALDKLGSPFLEFFPAVQLVFLR